MKANKTNTQSSGTLVLDPVQEDVAKILSSPVSKKLEQRLLIEWDAIPSFGLTGDSTAAEIADKVLELGDYAAFVFPGVKPPPLVGLKYMMGMVIDNLVSVKEFIAYTMEIEHPGKTCGIRLDARVFVKALILFMAVHMLIGYNRENCPDNLVEEVDEEAEEKQGKINPYRYLTVVSHVVTSKLLKLGTYTWVNKSELTSKF